MRRLMMAVAAAAIVSVGSPMASSARLQAQEPAGFSIHATNAAPNSALELALNGGKVGEIRSDATGSGSSILDFANLGKVQVQVFVERCEDGKIVRVRMIVVGEVVPEDEGCDRKPVGLFWTHNVQSLTINVATGTMQVDTSGLSGPIKIGIGAAVVGGAAIAISSGGGSSSSSNGSGTGSGTGTNNPGTTGPGGNYPTTIVVQFDPANHRLFIGLASNVVLVVSLNGSNMTVTGPANSNWVTVSGTFNTGSGSGVLTGNGVVAGVNNVSVRLTLNISSTGAMTGTLVMGANGELPGGQSITYGLMGQRQ